MKKLKITLISIDVIIANILEHISSCFLMHVIFSYTAFKNRTYCKC